MLFLKELEEHLLKNNIEYKFVNDENETKEEYPILKINNELFLLLSLKIRNEYWEEGINIDNHKDYVLFDQNFHLLLSEDEKDKIALGFYGEKIKYLIFDFGGEFYYTKINDYKKLNEISPKLNLLRYLGNINITKQYSNFQPLGIRGKMEIMNGLGEYKDYVKKAKFLGCNVLGICEYNTLAGTFQFQQECKQQDIKSILGETICFRLKEDDINYFGKCYVLNRDGWKNLLKINRIINDRDKGFILQKDLLKYGKGLVFVFDVDSILSVNQAKLFLSNFTYVYIQLSSVIFSNEQKDKNYLESIKRIIDNEELSNYLEFILIDDIFYLEKENRQIKKIINRIVTPSVYQSDSKNQYFKNSEEILDNLSTLFNPDKNKWTDREKSIIHESIINNEFLISECNFEIPLGQFHLPEFKLDHLKNNIKYNNIDKEDLFFSLLDEGLIKKKLDNKQEYIDRLDEELEVIYKGGFVDYFMILWDIIRFCKENNIITGIGRGSAAGSLIAYLLDITKIDPIKYGLLFSRFLNEGRIGKSLPDIDQDLQINSRDLIKNYLKQLYGVDYFCSIGAYVNTKIKSGLKDLSRIYKIDFNKVNIMTSILSLKEGKDGDFEELFKASFKYPMLYQFIKSNPKLINQLQYLLKHPKAKKIHPCATIIMPKYEGENLFDYLPIRSEGENNDLITEWEGTQIESAGFLKEDLLGLEQLDKIGAILKRIKDDYDKDIDISLIPLDDKKVMDFFKLGYTSDIFQFGTSGLTSFCKELLPDNLEELINMVALYRPGPIGSGAHTEYMNIKFGKSKPVYDYGVEEIVKTTFGIYIFQEQVMKVMEALGGFNPVECDDIRKAMGKKKESLLVSYKEQFIKGAINNGCKEDEAIHIWDKMVRFSEYGFNKSHAAAYATTGYISQWLKVYYPLQFWTVSLDFARDEQDIFRYLEEIESTNKNIQIVPPDINKSSKGFECDKGTNKIYWSLEKVKYLGEKGLTKIFESREKNGLCYSLTDFISRFERSDVNKRVCLNLILSGCFDETCSISVPRFRKNIIEEYCKIYNENYEKLPFIEQNKNLLDKDYFWIIKQKEISGFGLIDYKKLLLTSDQLKEHHRNYISNDKIKQSSSINKNYSCGGIIKSYTLGRTKTNKRFATMLVEANNLIFTLFFWEYELERFEFLFKEENVNKLLLFSAELKFNSFKKENSFYLNRISKVDLL